MSSLLTRVLNLAGIQNQQPHHFGTSSLPNQAQLPVELLLYIVSFVRDRADLIRLASTSRTLKVIAEPNIYKNIQIKADGDQLHNFGDPTICITKRERLLALFRTLQAPLISTYIFRLRIKLDGMRLRDCQRIPLNLPKTVGDESCCQELDTKLGDAITQLSNLEVLSIHCISTGEPPTTPRHKWLANLKSELRVLDFTCFCFQWQPSDITILRAPCFNKLKAVKLYIQGPPANQQGYTSRLQDLVVFPPMIDTLAFNSTLLGRSLGLLIVASATVKNIVFTNGNLASPYRGGLLTDTLKTRGTKVELLFMLNFRHWFPTQDPTPYLNLRSVGSIHFQENPTNDIVLQITEPFSSLKQLRMIEFTYDPDSHQLPNDWKDDLFSDLQTRHPLLQRIYVVGRSWFSADPTAAALYETSEGVWRRRPARFLNYWEIATGESYELPEWMHHDKPKNKMIPADRGLTNKGGDKKIEEREERKFKIESSREILAKARPTLGIFLVQSLMQ
ncbi:hypothetical protein FRC17_001887 [Serendipita sp. 399]|nr:hypothetical protein FRC17_001887 [Serendipita sp. 399]